MALDYIGGNPGNYLLGRGKLYLKGEFGTTLTDGGWRDIGNCTAFTLTQESEKKEHLSYLTGVKTIDLEVAVSTKVTIAFTIDEVQNLLNQAPFLSGVATGYNAVGGNTGITIAGVGTMPALFNAACVDSDDTAAWALGGPVQSGTINYHRAAGNTALGFWYDLELPFMVTTGSIAGGTWRAYGFETQASQPILVEKNPSGRTAGSGTALTEGTHYEIDRAMGRIRLLPGASFAPATDVLLVSWAKPTVDRHPPGNLQGLDTTLNIIKPLTSTGITVGLKFVLDNPNNNLKTEYELFAIKLSPDGELALLGDDWGSMAFTGVASTIASPPIGASPYGRISGLGAYPSP